MLVQQRLLPVMHAYDRWFACRFLRIYIFARFNLAG